MTDTKEPRTLKELREVASRLDKAIFEEDLTIEETLIVLMMMEDGLSVMGNMAVTI